MTLEQNKTPFFSYLVMAILSIAAIITIGVIYKPEWYIWAVGGLGIALGFVVMAVQVWKSGDTTALGYVIQAVTAAIFCTWAVLSIPAV